LVRFNPVTGWPEKFKVRDAIQLQTWHEKAATHAWGSKEDALHRLLCLDQSKGTVEVTTTTSTKQVKRSRVIEDRGDIVPKSWTTHRFEDKEVKTDYITAEAFAAWLAAHEMAPSSLVAAWFKAMAVNADRRRIEPPQGWKAQNPHGLQRLDSTDAGRLVRLADLVQWLMDTKELPCKTATEAVCSVFERSPDAAAGWLFLLTEADFARPLPAGHSFFYLPIIAIDEPYPTGEATDKGLAGAIKYMREYWGQSASPNDDKWAGQHVLDPLAVRVDVAHLLWGYGRRVDETEKTQAATPAPLSDKTVQPVQRSTAQDTAILNAIREAGCDPLKLPKPPQGKAGIKATVRAALVGKNPVFPQKGAQFEKAWERLRSRREIAYLG